jgi:hypothetical protein
MEQNVVQRFTTTPGGLNRNAQNSLEFDLTDVIGEPTWPEPFLPTFSRMLMRLEQGIIDVAGMLTCANQAPIAGADDWCCPRCCVRRC